MTIFQQGQINTTALVVPNLYVQIVPPQNLVLNGVPTNVAGVVGTATWGPVGKPTIVSNMADYARQFGAIQNRKYDMGTCVTVAVRQGASNFRCVRVTDGTDVAASVVAQSTCITFTSIYTGTLGNSIVVSVAPGSKTGTFKAVVGLPGQQPEAFDNIAGSANALWVAMAAAINSGNSVLRGPSQSITATAGVGTTAPATAAYAMTGGTDGVATLTAAVLIGVDTIPRTGMYALRGQGCSLAALADADDSTQWTTQVAFGLAEGIYMMGVGPAGDTISNAVSTKASAGIDSYSMKLMFGDWIYWNDPVNGVLRLVSPQGFVMGRLANLSPEQSSLNKPLFDIVSTQKVGAPGSGMSGVYSDAELQTMFQPGIDVITNPVPGGSYYGVRLGHNTSSNAGTSGDNYTRLTNYIAATLNAGMGLYVGQVINIGLLRRIRATQLAFLQGMLQQGLLGLNSDGSLPFSVLCDASNNPDTRTALGYVQSDAQIRYQAINEKFIINLEGGTTVTVARQTLPTGQA
jgi:hypothetical protein